MSLWKTLSPTEQASCLVASSKPKHEFTFKGIKKLKAWEVRGPLSEEWNKVLPKIIEVSSEQNFRQTIFGNDRRHGVATLPKWSLYLVGSGKAKVEKLKPWVIAGHRDADVAKRASRAMEDLSDGSLAPILQGYEFYYMVETIIPCADNRNGLNLGTSSYKVNLCGLHVIISNSDPQSSSPSTSWRHSTIGGCVEINGKHYGLTAAHAFQDSTTEDPLSPQQQGEQSDNESNIHHGFGLFQHRRVYAHNTVPGNAQNGSSDHLDHHSATGILLNGNRSDSEENSVASVIYNLSKDWALVPITNESFDTVNKIDLGNGHHASVSGVTAVSSQKPVFIASGVTSPAFTMFSGTASAILLPGSDQLQMVWTAPRASVPGDCGSWVIDEDGHPMGMVVAASVPSPGEYPETYCLPLTPILDDIQNSLNHQPVIPGSQLVESGRITESHLSLHPSWDTFLAEQDDAENTSPGSPGSTGSSSNLGELGSPSENETNPRHSQTSVNRKRQKIDWNHHHDLQTSTGRTRLTSYAEHSSDHKPKHRMSDSKHTFIKPLKRQATVESDEDEPILGTDTEHEDESKGFDRRSGAVETDLSHRDDRVPAHHSRSSTSSAVKQRDELESTNPISLQSDHDSDISKSETVIPKNSSTSVHVTNQLDKEDNKNSKRLRSRAETLIREVSDDPDTILANHPDSSLAEDSKAQALQHGQESETAISHPTEIHGDDVEAPQVASKKSATLQDETVEIIPEDGPAREEGIQSTAPRPGHSEPPVAGPMVVRAREREDFVFVPRRRQRSPSPEYGETVVVRRYEPPESRLLKNRSEERIKVTGSEQTKSVNTRPLSRERISVVINDKVQSNERPRERRYYDSDGDDEIIIRRDERRPFINDDHVDRWPSVRYEGRHRASSQDSTRANDGTIVTTRRNDSERRTNRWADYEEREEIHIRRTFRRDPEEGTPRRERSQGRERIIIPERDRERSREQDRIVIRERPSPPLSPYPIRERSREREEIIIRRDEPSTKLRGRSVSRDRERIIIRREEPNTGTRRRDTSLDRREIIIRENPLPRRERSEERISIWRNEADRSLHRRDTSWEQDVVIRRDERDQQLRDRSRDRNQIIIRRDERDRSRDRWSRRRWSRDRNDTTISRYDRSPIRTAGDRYYEREEIIIRRDEPETRTHHPLQDSDFNKGEIVIRRNTDDETRRNTASHQTHSNALVRSEFSGPRRVSFRPDFNELHRQNQERMDDIVLGVMEESNRITARRNGKLDNKVFSKHYIDPEVLDSHGISWRYIDDGEKLIELRYGSDEAREMMLRTSTKALQQRRLEATQTAETNRIWNIGQDMTNFAKPVPGVSQDESSRPAPPIESRAIPSGPSGYHVERLDQGDLRSNVIPVQQNVDIPDDREQHVTKALERQLDLKWENFVQDELWKAGCSTEVCDEILAQHAAKELRKHEFAALEAERHKARAKKQPVSSGESWSQRHDFAYENGQPPPTLSRTSMQERANKLTGFPSEYFTSLGQEQRLRQGQGQGQVPIPMTMR